MKQQYITAFLIATLVFPLAAVDAETDVRPKGVEMRQERVENRVERQENTAELRKEQAEKKEAFASRREAFVESRTAWQGATPEERDAMKQEMARTAKAFLDESVDALVARLERMKAWVDGHPNIDDATEEEIIATLDAEIARVRAFVADLGDDASVEDVRTAATALRERMKDYKTVVQDAIARMKASRVAAGVTNLTSFVERIDAKIAAYTADGVDMSEATTALDRVKASLDTAETADDIKAIYRSLKDVLAKMATAVRAHHTVALEE